MGAIETIYLVCYEVVLISYKILTLYYLSFYNFKFLLQSIYPGPDDGGGPDLESAARQRKQYYEYLHSNFKLIGGRKEQELPNGNRIWKRLI